ncbi:MAG: cation:proton antiporter [Nitrospinae bacterium RIFCSPLOWO2_02_FULL_39_110]|nr:MAG: cation:proton antiporter [Nitrospinae bacterium RIFCSPHIGHO2_12_FULL_39_42]OGV99977.1 MAG: cation:proton antiporter [Nitrospinae bacterium RIFCSPHIGHO2_02_FULL_39_82]OGW05931.1 MAG: cation:proton antiporter [Nitrospinae bacterium RIFCSPLOWO2_02_39_17]OGW06209.1 MAG: cation:proton antiporter [Nitrospinae bacterium RIFCSPLOWO2_02_FULL_39_110]OGW08666.1 MAG: cation:proton antiporter [Nitrospinae bacterium RIFCSPLOWO2_12_39_15]OGW11708.1 MAG: cation:proton antiporter [Nitrospinae bacterium
MEIESIKPLLAVATSLLGAAVIVVTRKSPNIREGCSLGAAILKFLIVATMIPPVLAGKTLHMTLFSFLPEVSIALRVDALGLLFATTASFLWIVTTLYSIGYMRSLNEHAQTRYYLCFAITMSATMAVAFSANLLTLYIFYELITFFTYPLVTHKETDEVFAAGNKYIFYLLMSAKFFLLAIILTYAFAGTLDFRPNGLFASKVNPTILTLIYFLFLVGISKAAIMPFHAWLPAAMVAPAPVSALLHAVAVVNTGVFCVLRVIFHIFGVELMKVLNLGAMTALIASFTIIIASIYAFTRDDLKERLAYSTISQLSYIVLGGALLTSSGMAGGIMHIANHAFSKITLFFCAGSIYVASHKTHISQLDGIGKQMPWTMAAFSIGALSIIGIPPLAGSVTKTYLASGSTVAYGLPIRYVLWASLLLNAGYFLPIVYKAFFKAPKQEGALQIQEPSYFIVIPLFVCAAISVILGIYPKLLLDMIGQVIR